MRLHLSSIHGITAGKLPKSAIQTTATETVEELYNKLLLQLGNSEHSIDQEIYRRTVNQQVVDETLLDLIIVRRLPFSCVEWPEWHAFVQALNPQGHVFMPTSHNTVRQRVDTWFLQAKDIMRRRLQSSQTKVLVKMGVHASQNDLHRNTPVSGSFRL